jgi:uncharacterized membrane protein YgdD (TMEM256/DUF423 family)
LASASPFLIPALLGSTAVLLGALGAHALKAICTPEQLQSFETAVRYQIYHSIALLVLCSVPRSACVKLTERLWLWGTVLFSGSIYVLLFLKIQFHATSLSALGIITPLGGILMILGWLNVIRFKRT